MILDYLMYEVLTLSRRFTLFRAFIDTFNLNNYF